MLDLPVTSQYEANNDAVPTADISVELDGKMIMNIGYVRMLSHLFQGMFLVLVWRD
jgi:hypothetical protein